MIRRILAAVDNSERARGVVALATEVAEKFAAQVHLFRVVGVPPEIPAGGHQAAGDVLAPVLMTTISGELHVLANGHPLVTVEPALLSQEAPWQAISAAAERLDVDLIVVGSHGFHGWDRLLGTNAGHLADHARRHVLVVHGNS